MPEPSRSLSCTGRSQCYSLRGCKQGGLSSASGPQRTLTGRGFSVWLLLVAFLKPSIFKKSPGVVVLSQVEVGASQQSLRRRAPTW